MGGMWLRLYVAHDDGGIVCGIFTGRPANGKSSRTVAQASQRASWFRMRVWSLLNPAMSRRRSSDDRYGFLLQAGFPHCGGSSSRSIHAAASPCRGVREAIDPCHHGLAHQAHDDDGLHAPQHPNSMRRAWGCCSRWRHRRRARRAIRIRCMAFALVLGIGLQNFPRGRSGVVAACRREGFSRWKAFVVEARAIVEPIFGVAVVLRRALRTCPDARVCCRCDDLRAGLTRRSSTPISHSPIL